MLYKDHMIMAELVLYTKAQLDEAVHRHVAAAVAAERMRTDAVQAEYQALLSHAEESLRETRAQLNKVLTRVSEQNEEIENLKCAVLARAMIDRNGIPCGQQACIVPHFSVV
jgi:hypothetical protein